MARLLPSIKTPTKSSRPQTHPRNCFASSVSADSGTPRSFAHHAKTSRYGSGLAEAYLPPEGWAFDYTAVEAPRRGRQVLRPAVPINFVRDANETIEALVDSGSEHTLAAHWWADELGIDLAASNDRLLLGIGGRSVEATFVHVELRLHRSHRGDEFISWFTDVGFLEPWDAQFYVILGQTGFFDQFTVTMNRRLLTVKVSDVESI